MVTRWFLLAKLPASMQSTSMNSEVKSQHVIEVVSDTICPWCYIGLARLEKALAHLSEDQDKFLVRHVPFQLNPDMPIEGLDRRAYRSRKFGTWERSQQMDAQVAEAGRQEGLLFNHEAIERTPNTLPSHVLIHLAEKDGVQEQVIDALFRGYFTEGRDIGSHEVLAELGRSAGMQRAQLKDALRDPAVRATVRSEADRATRNGISGVPTFILDGTPLFSGAQPPATMVAAIEGRLQKRGSKGLAT